MNVESFQDSFMPASRFRPFEVIGKRAENRLITSFILRPLSPQDWRPFEPGQFLILRIPDTKGGHVLKHYSISSDPAVAGTYRITVKREQAPRPGLPDGIGSGYMHGEVEVGSILEIEGPRGEFRLNRESRRPLVLLAGGVGLTPLVSMLHAASRDVGRPVIFIHACQDGSLHALPEEIIELAQRRAEIALHFIYQNPSQADRQAGRHHSEGFISRALLQRLLPLDDYDFYMCGPSPFMQAVYALLRGLGVARERIAYEFFGPATVLDPDKVAPISPPAVQTPATIKPAGDERTVTFARSGLMAAWSSSSPSLLDFAEANGLDPEFSCRAGICGTCKVRLLEGDVDYFETPLDPPDAGEVLICCSRPRGSLVLDL